MDSEEAVARADLFLREIPKIKIRLTCYTIISYNVYLIDFVISLVLPNKMIRNHLSKKNSKY